MCAHIVVSELQDVSCDSCDVCVAMCCDVCAVAIVAMCVQVSFSGVLRLGALFFNVNFD